MPRTGKPSKPSQSLVNMAHWPSKWRLRHCTPSPMPAAVPCFASRTSTNQMAVAEGDFEKGEADGARDSLDVIVAAARGCGFPKRGEQSC